MFHCFIVIRTMIIWWTEVYSNPISVHLSTRVTFFILADSPYIHLCFALLLIASFIFIVQPVHKTQEFCWGKYWCSSVRIVGRIIRRFRLECHLSYCSKWWHGRCAPWGWKGAPMMTCSLVFTLAPRLPGSMSPCDSRQGDPVNKAVVNINRLGFTFTVFFHCCWWE